MTSSIGPFLFSVASRLQRLQPKYSTKISALQRLQNRAFDIIEASKIKDSFIRPALNIDQMFQFDRSVLMFKMINKTCPKSPKSLHNKYAERSTISKYYTRNKTDLQIPRLNLDFSRKSFTYTGLKTWNSIPTYIRESSTLTRFKNGLTKSFSKLKKNYFFF